MSHWWDRGNSPGKGRRIYESLVCLGKSKTPVHQKHVWWALGEVNSDVPNFYPES